jgi:hypothetical protein
MNFEPIIAFLEEELSDATCVVALRTTENKKHVIIGECKEFINYIDSVLSDTLKLFETAIVENEIFNISLVSGKHIILIQRNPGSPWFFFVQIEKASLTLPAYRSRIYSLKKLLPQ